jgi:hypothetical protein
VEAEVAHLAVLAEVLVVIVVQSQENHRVVEQALKIYLRLIYSTLIP